MKERLVRQTLHKQMCWKAYQKTTAPPPAKTGDGPRGNERPRGSQPDPLPKEREPSVAKDKERPKEDDKTTAPPKRARTASPLPPAPFAKDPADKKAALLPGPGASENDAAVNAEQEALRAEVSSVARARREMDERHALLREEALRCGELSLETAEKAAKAEKQEGEMVRERLDQAARSERRQ